jgi:exonuclease SbcD
MRFLHTADWHIGKSLFGRSRLDEQEKVIDEIVDIARRMKVDCVLLAGDVFESTSPPAEAERLVCDALAEFTAARITTVVVGGNHDHPKRLGALRKIGVPLDIHIRPEPARAENGGVITLEMNGERAQIAVLPWVAEHRIVDITRMMNPEDTWFAEYSMNVAAMCRQLAAGFRDDTINILTAHLFVFGAETSGTERAVHVASPFAVKAEMLPTRAQYIALGHLHKPQELPGGSRVLYSGSPIQVDFGERGQEKRVVIIDLKAGFPAEIESVSLTRGRRLREVTTTADGMERIANETSDDFLRVIVRSDTRIPGLARRVSEQFPNAIDIRQEVAAAAEVEPAADSSMASPVEFFERYVREQRNETPTQQMLAKFRELYAEAQNEAG